MIAKHKPIWNNLANKTRYFVLTGGRGSGKSFEVGRFTSLLSFETGHKILFTRQTMTSAHLSIIPEFQEKINLLELNQAFDIRKSEIVNTHSKSEIIFRGIKTSSGDQTANLKSLQGVTTWILDEAEEQNDESVFDKINFSIRQKGKQNRIILILNPTTKEHFVYKKFFEQAGVEAGFNGTKDNVTYIHTTYLDNIDNLDQSFIDEAERMRVENPSKYHHVMMGGWLDKAEGVVFTNWKFGEFNPDGLQTSFGMHFGFSIDPDTLTEVAIDNTKKKLYLKQHIYQNRLKTHELCQLVKSIANDKLIVADSSESRLIEDMKAFGINVVGVKKGTIESGVQRMQDFEIIVEPNSHAIAKELNNYVYLNRVGKLYVDNYNHAIDGIRYNVIHHLDNPNTGKYFVY